MIDIKLYKIKNDEKWYMKLNPLYTIFEITSDNVYNITKKHFLNNGFRNSSKNYL